MSKAVADHLFVAKGEAFISIADIVEPFLKRFQSDAPMVSFLVGGLSVLILSLIKRVVKPPIFDTLISSEKLVKFDLDNKASFVETREVDIGFIAKQQIATLKAKLVAEVF